MIYRAVVVCEQSALTMHRHVIIWLLSLA